MKSNKKVLNERFQELAGIKPLYNITPISEQIGQLGDRELVISAPAESSIETRDINRTVLQLHDKEAGEDVGFIQLNVLDLMSRGVDKVGKQEIYDEWAAFSKALDDNSVAGI